MPPEEYARRSAAAYERSLLEHLERHGAPDGDPEDAGRRAAATASAGQAWAADAGPFYDPQRPVTGWTITAWLTSPDPDRDGLTPVELLQADRPDPVITAAGEVRASLGTDERDVGRAARPPG